MAAAPFPCKILLSRAQGAQAQATRQLAHSLLAEAVPSLLPAWGFMSGEGAREQCRTSYPGQQYPWMHTNTTSPDTLVIQPGIPALQTPHDRAAAHSQTTHTGSPHPACAASPTSVLPLQHTNPAGS
jgi:hypothetical protein